MIRTEPNFIDTFDLKNSKIDLSLYKKLNELLSYNQSLAPGTFRKEGHYAYIPCIKDPISAPSIIEINYQLDCLNSLSLNNYKSQVSCIFCILCKFQPFYDGNKRSTLCLCNLALLKQNKEMLIIKNNQYNDFDRLLTEFYVGSNENLISFLVEECFEVNSH